MEKRAMPYIGLEMDYSESDSGQLAAWIEAFLEMIDPGAKQAHYHDCTRDVIVIGNNAYLLI